MARGSGGDSRPGPMIPCESMRETLHGTRFGWAIGLAMMMAAGSGEARADAVGPGPAECPDGATPNACHGAEYCSATVCTNDTACTDGKVCRLIPMCIRMDTCFGGDSGSDTPVKDLLKVCGEGDSCAEGTCESLFLCVDPEEPTTGGGGGSSGASGGSEGGDGGGGKGGCSCRSGGDAAPFMGLALLLGLVVRRRRR